MTENNKGNDNRNPKPDRSNQGRQDREPSGGQDRERQDLNKYKHPKNHEHKK